MSLCTPFSYQASLPQAAGELTRESSAGRKDSDQPCFTKKEVRDILSERNELKTNLFLVQEELSYYQRWVRFMSFSLHLRSYTKILLNKVLVAFKYKF